MKYFSILMLLVLFSCKSGKDVSNPEQDTLGPAVSEMINRLVEADYIGTESIGRSPEPSPAYANREALLSLATEEELLKLIDHPEGEVAATAFEGLVRRNYTELKTALLNLSKGDRTLRYIQGDMFFTMPALEYAYVNILGNKMEGNLVENTRVDIGLSSAEKAFVENRILAIRQTF